MHAQACYLAGQAAEKVLTRMNSASRYPQGAAAPVDLLDANDSTTALGTGEAVVRIAAAQLQA